MPFPDSVDDKLNVEGLNLFSNQDYVIETTTGKKIDLKGDVRINGINVITADELPFVDVKQSYGAVGNGTANDTTAIQAAINACAAAGGGIVYFPRGTYLISATLTVPSFVCLQGVGGAYRSPEYGIDPSGVTSSIKHAAGSSFAMIRNSDTTNGNSSMEIRGLRFIQGLGGEETGDATIIDWNKVRRSLISDCYFQGWATTSRKGLVIANGSEHNFVFRSQFEGCGIHLLNVSNRIVIQGCEIGAGGIRVVGGFDNMILDCDLYTDGISGSFPQYPSIIYVQDVTAMLIRGNQVAGALEHGMYLTNMVKSTVSDNEVKDSSRESAGVWSGITLDSIGGNPCTSNVIRGNTCWDALNVSGTQKNGIGVYSTAVGTADNLIVGNNLQGNRTNAAEQSVGLKNQWRDNLGTLTASVASAATITVPPGCEFLTVTGTTNITSITAGYTGQRVILFFTGILTVTDGSNLGLNGNFVTTANDTLTLVSDGTNWFETARSAN